MVVVSREEVCAPTLSGTPRNGKPVSAAVPTRYSMNGNEHDGLVIQERDRHLLQELAVMRVIDREQVKTVAGFGSTTRANSRLLALTSAGLLRRFFLGTTGAGQKALYALSPKGAQLVGVPLRAPRRRKD